MNNSDQIRDVLTDIGYSLRDYGKEYRAKPIYRDSDNNTVLSIKKDTGRWIDFKEGISGSFEELIKLSLNLSSIDDAKKFLVDKVGISPEKVSKPRVTKVKILPKGFLNKLIKNNFYWNQRGVSDNTLDLFGGGVCEAGKMVGRYVFPIFNNRDKLVGASGRDVYGNYDNRPKWKHIGNKSSWTYPLQVNKDSLLKRKKIILIESIGDMLSLWEAGVKNTMVTFGLDISSAVLNTLLRLDPREVIISFNNDEENNFAGNKASEKARKKLRSHFDERQIIVSLPTKKDFGEMSPEEIGLWNKKN
jgi:5S rRNA maturation endonuclease (ribonuclease M5)